MRAQKSKDNKSHFAYLIGLFFLASSALFGVFVISEDHLNLPSERVEGQADFSSTHKTTDLDKVNDHLKSVSDKMETDRLKALVANLKASHDTGPSQPIAQRASDEPIVEIENGMRERQLAQELGRTNEFKKPATDPRSIVYNSVIQDRENAKAKEEERRRLAKEFVAKARKEGWIVNLDSDYKIKSYRHVDETPEKEQETDYRGYSVVPK
ncbi:MAG: hypothetical protein JNM24_03485 [Bdellovibrionaceae bacterium]|nr:hypothetical protein [Pseudobdellovibrionaceae bacterium]